MTAPDSSSSISDRQSQGLINALEFFIFHWGTFWCLLCRRWIFTLLLSLCLTLVSLNCSTIPPNLVAVQLLCFVQRANLVVGSLKTSRKSGRNFSWYLSFTPFTWFTYPNWICSRPLSTKRNSFITHIHTHTGYSSMVYGHEDSASSSLGGEALLCLECGVGEGSKGKGTCAKVVELKTKGTISFYVTVKQTSWKTRRDDAWIL